MKMRSQASAKFFSQHPAQHKLLISQINSAKIQKTCPVVEREEEGDKSPEILNMRKNKQLMLFTDEDRLREEERRSIKMMNKRISWSKHLIEIKIIIKWQNELAEETEEY